MVFGVTSPRNSLSPLQAFELARIYLQNAYNATDANITFVLCHDTEVSLSQVKKAAKQAKDNVMLDRIATAYVNLGNLLDSRGYQDEAKTSFKKAQKLG